MTLPLPYVVLPPNYDAVQIQANFDEIAKQFPVGTNAVANNFVRLLTAANVKITYGTLSSNFDSTAGRSRKVWTGVAHGLGATPTYVFCSGMDDANITEDGGATAHSYSVVCNTQDNTNLGFIADINGTSNNSLKIAWLAILVS